MSERVLVAEDVITTGGSTKEVIDVVKSFGGKIAGVACLVDRSGKSNLFGDIPMQSLLKIDIQTYAPEACPLCKKKIPIDKPGSR